MPELPEVETTRRGVAPYVCNHVIEKIDIFEPRLRWPVPGSIEKLQGRQIHSVDRRAKYLLFRFGDGTMIVHLGMSGSLRLCSSGEQRRRHDHVVFTLSTNQQLRFHDPRRFGCILWHTGADESHALLAHLGPEPLADAFDGDYLFHRSRKRKLAIKNFIMDNQVVVGVGNIYASEALYLSSIRPGRAAGRVTRTEYQHLAANIRSVLSDAIEVGGTTLRDFVNSSGEPGYFQQSLNVYGRRGEACRVCGQTIRQRNIGQRSSFYCPVCQK